MTKLYIALDEALVVASQTNGAWPTALQLTGKQAQCLARDPLRPEYVYCGTFGQGLWRSHDAGKSWQEAGAGITHLQITSVAVSETERTGELGVVYAGTEPSAIFRSEDGGETWREMETLRQLPSAPTWSFPPRPYTSHVRWITPDPLIAGRVFAAIEAGALVHSLDGGAHWEDRSAAGPFDTHTLVMHPLAPNRLYSSAGDGFLHSGQGFVQSEDGGASWFRPDEGLHHHYLWGLAADPANPETLVISAAPGPQEAHNPAHALSAMYRRSENGPWQLLHDGLPEQKGMLASVIAVNPAEPGVFYAANNQGIFRSADTGLSWEKLTVNWPDGAHTNRPAALIVTSEA